MSDKGIRKKKKERKGYENSYRIRKHDSIMKSSIKYRIKERNYWIKNMILRMATSKHSPPTSDINVHDDLGDLASHKLVVQFSMHSRAIE